MEKWISLSLAFTASSRGTHSAFSGSPGLRPCRHAGPACALLAQARCAIPGAGTPHPGAAALGWRSWGFWPVLWAYPSDSDCAAGAVRLPRGRGHEDVIHRSFRAPGLGAAAGSAGRLRPGGVAPPRYLSAEPEAACADGRGPCRGADGAAACPALAPRCSTRPTLHRSWRSMKRLP